MRDLPRRGGLTGRDPHRRRRAAAGPGWPREERLGATRRRDHGLREQRPLVRRRVRRPGLRDGDAARSGPRRGARAGLGGRRSARLRPGHRLRGLPLRHRAPGGDRQERDPARSAAGVQPGHQASDRTDARAALGRRRVGPLRAGPPRRLGQPGRPLPGGTGCPPADARPGRTAGPVRLRAACLHPETPRAVGRGRLRQRPRRGAARRARTPAARPRGPRALQRQQLLPRYRGGPEPQGTQPLRPTVPTGPHQCRPGLPRLSDRDHGPSLAGGLLRVRRRRLVAHPAARPGRDRSAGGSGQQAGLGGPDRRLQPMVDHVLRLGFVVPEQVDASTVFVEVERDPQFPRR